MLGLVILSYSPRIKWWRSLKDFMNLFRGFLLSVIGFFLLTIPWVLFGQSLPSGFPLIEEFQRRKQLVNNDSVGASFFLRPIESIDSLYGITHEIDLPFSLNELEVGVLPFINIFAGIFIFRRFTTIVANISFFNWSFCINKQ